ncbi:MAG: polysaccharide deacetylase family protein [Bacteroidales bacterium]|nr:polysaccharide deacetylase family protein [Bacteroidales bacterium]
MELLILVPKISNRLFYIFELIFKELICVKYRITTDREVFIACDGPKLNYGNNNIGDELFQKASRLLFERNIHDIQDNDLKIIDFKDTKAIFPVYSDKSMFPFDPFAASFFLVTRYEEYLPHVCDKHNRYQAKDSILFKMNMLERPLVNIWAKEFGERLKAAFPELDIKKRTFTFIPTYDVDAAWAYKNKGLFRISAAFFRDLLNLDFEEIKTRWQVLTGKRKDPFDTFDFQIQLQKNLNLHPIYFILCGGYDLNDKNISLRNVDFQNLIKRLGDYADVGIHPSFASYLNTNKMRDEITDLSKVLNSWITKSRQHFLRLNLPSSYQKLIELDITDDYTMGYASQAGFRAGIASTFKFFDLTQDTVTKLNIHPFAVMDGTLRDYLNLGNEESLEKVKRLITEVKNVDGTFILLWHNETLSDEKRWTGWVALYQEILNFALNRQ